MKKKRIFSLALAIVLSGVGVSYITSGLKVHSKTFVDYAVYPDDFTEDEIYEIENYGSLRLTRGDADGNGVVNASDMSFLRSFIIGQKNDATIRQKTNSDMNNDLRINIMDFIELKKYFFTDDEPEDEEYAVEPIDAEKFLDRIGEIESQTDVENSNDCLTEKEVLELLADRGFENVAVLCSFDMEGNLTDDKVITEENATSEIHPIYDAYYESENNEIWNISVVNGSVYANPLIYNFKENLTVAVVISETGYMTSYDNVTNKFFELKPDPTEIAVKKAELITAEYLSGLTEEEIDNL